MTQTSSENNEYRLIDSSEVSIKGITCHIILTNQRLILVEHASQISRNVDLSDIQKIKSDSNLNGDPSILLSIRSPLGENKRMILSFIPKGSDNRQNERNQWIAELENSIIPVASVTPQEQHESIYCSNCGKPVDLGSLFCNKCGARLPKIPEILVKCPKCGTTRISDESIFCSRCGTSFLQIPVQPVVVPAKSSSSKIQIPPQTSENSGVPVTIYKTCPNCGAPITDENRFYCRECGAYIRNKSSSTNSPGKSPNLMQKTSSQNLNTGAKSQNPYSMNIILILLLGLGLLGVFYPPFLVLIVIISAIAVYYDAKAIGAGGHSQNGSMNNEESTFSTYTWSPLSWGLVVLLLWIIGLPLYLIKRRELFELNIHGSIPVGVTRSTYPDTPYNASLGNSYESNRSLTTEFILGLLGGIIGFFAGFAAIAIGGIGGAFGIASAGTVIAGGAGAIVFSILGIIGAAIVNRHTKTAGYLMIISAICGLICISLFYVLSFILLIIAGILAVKNAPPSQMGPAL